MNISSVYVFSQILAIGATATNIISYYQKNRAKIIFLNVIYIILYSTHYFLLNAYTAGSLLLLCLFRSLYLYIKERTNKPKNIAMLIIFLILQIICAMFTWQGVISFLPLAATLLFTISLWNNNLTFYKVSGLIVTLLYIANNICLKSVAGIISEVITLILISIATIEFFKGEKKNDS